jgi:hypothetical protein
LKKTSRRADASPDMNDILTGLLNVVGEGLNIATNYVKSKEKENSDNKKNKKKKGEGANKVAVQIRPSRY